MRTLVIGLIATLVLFAPRAAFCQESGPPKDDGEVDSATVQQIVDEVLSLRRQVDALLERLDVATRAAVERRLNELAGETSHERSRSPVAPAPGDGVPPTPAIPIPGIPDEEAASDEATAEDVTPAEPAAPPVEQAAPVPPAPTGPEDVTASSADREEREQRSDSPSGNCLPLGFLDSTDDATITGIDRAWRHLYLWSEAIESASADAAVPADVPSLFELGIRALSADLDTYTNDREFIGDVELGRWIWLEIPSRGRGRDFLRGALVVDADGLLRAGGPYLVGDDGEPIGGLRLLGRGAAIAWPDGRRQVFPDCAP